MATYKIIAELKKATLTFSGADRDATVTTASTSSYLEFYAADRGGTKVCFAPNQNLTILSAKLLSGLPGIVVADRHAANMTLIFGTQDDCDVDDTLVEVPLDIIQWNQTEKQVKSISGTLLSAETPVFAFLKTGSVFGYMDFNIQDDFNGEASIPQLELIIETDHLLTVAGEVFH